MGTRLKKGSHGDVLLDTLNEVIDESNALDLRRAFNGRKVVCFGDSIWHQNTIQPELIRLLGVEYSATEMEFGTDNHAPTAVPGTGIASGGAEAMYYRAADVHYYAPDLIVIEGGVNDTIGGEYGPEVYNHTDPVYTGINIAADQPSYVSVLKGMLRRLIIDNPAATIVFTGRWFYETELPTDDFILRVMARQAADEYCCRWAGVKYVDPLTLGLGFYNATTYFGGGSHPNQAGGILIARAFANAVSMV